MAESPSGSRPLLRTGGIALLGVGIIAATVGLFTSVTGGNGGGPAVPSASSQAVAPTGATVAPVPSTLFPTVTAAPQTVVAAPPPTASAVPQPAPASVAAPAPAPAPRAAAPAEQGGAAAGGAAAGGGGGGGAARSPLRVYNNSLIQGLAAQAKTDFESRGWTVTDISGYAGGNIAHSTAYFRPGTPEESAAQELGREFGLRVEPRFPGIAQSSDGVIVIVTEDFKTPGKS